MELTDLADRVLWSETLEGKWRSPIDAPTDRHPGPAVPIPDAPGRPAHLPLRAPGRRVSPPGPDQIRTDADRVSVLHALANHELLAAELFALALRRFPDAPAGLRRGWGQTLVDEQRHLMGYVSRIEALGGTFGDEPLSAFFWDALASAPDPMAFVAGMEVGLEQANLDFAGMWSRAFRRLGDDTTADLLDAVYEDEIRHVRIGVAWLRRLKDPALSDWEAWVGALRFPLTPARARAAVLDRGARRRADLDQDFVDRLAVAHGSKGRTPRIWSFDPHLEDDVAGRPRGGGGRVAADLSWVPALLAPSTDAVWATPPDPAWLDAWDRIGLGIPQFVTDVADLPGGRGIPSPWGWSPRTPKTRYRSTWRVLHDKTWAATQLAVWLQTREGPFEPRHAGQVCDSVAAVVAATQDQPRTWVKAGISTAGRHRLRLTGPLPAERQRWVEAALAVGPVVVESDLDVVAEISTHVDIDDDGVRDRGWVRFGASQGVFRGVIVGRGSLGLPPEVQRFAHQHRIVDHAAAAARFVGQQAWDLGYRGPLGVDALVVRDGDDLRLKPIGEVNPRYTMGRVALEVRRRVHGSGAWLFVPMRALRTAGVTDVATWLGASGGCAVSTTVAPKHLLTVLWIAPRFDDAVASLDASVQGLPGDIAPLRRALAWINAG